MVTPEPRDEGMAILSLSSLGCHTLRLVSHKWVDDSSKNMISRPYRKYSVILSMKLIQ
jgi:hypothetical protein